MWNFKRIVMLFIAEAVHVASYAAYAVFLGNIDALPPLPEHYQAGPPGEITVIKDDKPIVDRKLVESFGGNCQELQRPLRLWLPDRGAAFAAGNFNIEADGRVRLSPFSTAIYHKRKLPGDFPEISTLRCDTALLTLDKPIANFGELTGRKVIAVELRGKQIAITNNRGTPQKGDDLDVFIANAPLFYDESRDLISTDGIVCLTDYQAKPATVVRGKGMKMLLAKSTNPNAKAKPAAAGHSDSNNVEKIILESDVEMDFWTDGSSGFLGGTAPKKNAPPAEDEKPAEKAHIHIQTPGMFVYDMIKEFAWFERPPIAEGSAGKPAVDAFSPSQVHVVRRQAGKAAFDQLVCDRLELQFRRKPDDPGAPPGGGGSDKEIESAKAFKRGVDEVVLALDTEAMTAYGNEFQYYAGDGNKGSRTILKGDPLRSFKDGHKLVCRELQLQSANRAGEGQEVKAWGPGTIDLLDEKDPHKENRPTHISWLDTLTVVKAKEGSETFDLMTVEKEASFIDDIQKQQLHAEKIMVWLIAPSDSNKKKQAAGSNKQEVRKLVAERRVRAFGPEFVVRQAEHLTMVFLPEVAPGGKAPTLPKASDVDPGPMPKGGAGPQLPQPMGPPPGDPQQVVKNKAPGDDPKKPAPPIELTAKKISIHVSTVGGKKEVEGLVAKGKVYVFQPGEKPGEKKIDITGDLLTVKNYDDKGHRMVVHGEGKNMGRVELNDLLLMGPIVTIDQATNKAEVDGKGAAQMATNKNLDGSDVAKDNNKGKKGAGPNSRITVYFNKRMTFDGKNADFYGGVQAVQEGQRSWMLCEHLQTYLDRFVSFKEAPGDSKKEGADGKKDAKIDRIVCDQNVFIDDTKVDEKGRFVQRNKLIGWQLDNHQDGRTNVTGPGQCQQVSQGGSEPTLGPQKGGPQPKANPNAKADAKGQWMLTHVKFPARMFYNTEDKIKKATFWANPGSFVEVFHFPTIDIDATMNPDHPPKDGLYMRCENLVLRGEEHEERTTQVMIARQNVYFRTDTYTGNADLVKFDENTDMVTMQGANGNLVQLQKLDANGRPAGALIRAKVVLYNRKTGDVRTDGNIVIEN